MIWAPYTKDGEVCRQALLMSFIAHNESSFLYCARPGDVHTHRIEMRDPPSDSIFDVLSNEKEKIDPKISM